MKIKYVEKIKHVIYNIYHLIKPKKERSYGFENLLIFKQHSFKTIF